MSFEQFRLIIRIDALQTYTREAGLCKIFQFHFCYLVLVFLIKTMATNLSIGTEKHLTVPIYITTDKLERLFRKLMEPMMAKSAETALINS